MSLIIREHGGAYLKIFRNQVQTVSLAHQENLDKKELIAKKCLEFIDSGDTIILDSGSTTTEIAKKLKGLKEPYRYHQCSEYCLNAWSRTGHRDHCYRR